MTTYHDVVAALPVGANADKALERALLVRRYAYCLDTSESAASFTAVDPNAGTIPLYIIQNNICFRYDSTDSTTSADGVTCLVTADGKRYKSATVGVPWSVLSQSVSTPPGSPSVGDSYIVATAGTGAWAGKDTQIAIYTASGWVFAINPIGKSVYVEDVGSFYFRAVSGTWTCGFGNFAIASNAVPVSSLIGQPVRWFVVNQTTNTPPDSPSVGDAYIIGASPTGAWAGNAAKIAICETASSFTIYSPRVGEKAYDISLGQDFIYSGTSWTSSTGNWLVTVREYTTSTTWSKPARLFQVRIWLTGGGGGGSVSGGTPTGGGTTSFGTHMSATGGTATNTGTGANGTGVGGDINSGGPNLDFYGQRLGAGLGGVGADSTGGAGGSAMKVLQASSLSASEAVTIGAGGSQAAGGNGHMYLEEYTND